jgi:hypothetical protein
MSENARAVLQTDIMFFWEHPDRHFRIRKPLLGEYEAEFRTLGPHILERRRVIVSRVDKARARHFGVPYARIPFLQFADETIEDTDDVLKPIFAGFLQEAAAEDERKVIL